MPLDATRARSLLKAFDFTVLFLEELGWDRQGGTLNVMVDERPFVLDAIAHKRGMAAYRCPTPPGERLPNYATRRGIEQQVTRSVHEHFIIYTDAEQSTQIWQWVKREPGKPTACREHRFDREQSGDALIQKLAAIAFSLDEEERITLVEVTGRARAGFDVERVTKRFYEQFQKEHAAFLKFVAGIPDSADRAWYASAMLNRLMFVYFMQRKGFLDGDRDYLRNRLNQCRRERGEDRFYSFYRYFLLRLFHEGLGGRDRSPELDTLLGRIPYLNGGMFEKHPVEERYPDIQIPDQAFANIFDYFDRYQWYLDERPLRKDNEINPDVLGYIFEKYINQKQMGAYYTREDITEYIGKNTIIPFLFDAARSKCSIAFENPDGPVVWDLLWADPDRYIYPAVRHGVDLPLPPEIAVGLDTSQPDLLERRKNWNQPAPADHALPTEIWREVVARRTRCEAIRARLAAGEVRDINELITLNLDIRQFARDVIADCEGPELLRALWKAMGKVTVLDPTCGSGAFLFAALNILEPLYEACLERMAAFVAELDRSGVKHRPEKFSDFRQVLERVAAHPNRRYFILKSIILNNLFGVDIMEEATEICKLRLFLKLAAQVEPDPARENLGIEPLPDIDFNIRAGNTLVGFATYEEVRKAVGGQLDFDNAMEKIEIRAADLQQTFDAFRQRQIEGDGSVPVEHKLELRKRLKALEDELNHYLAAQYGKNPNNQEWLKSHQPFHWFVEFYGIMKSGGFDVIIGNPPYVEYRIVRDTYRLQNNQYISLSADNLYAFCMERSCLLVQPSGWFGMIVPTGVIGLDETISLRNVLLQRFNNNWCSTYAIRPSKLFDGVASTTLYYYQAIIKRIVKISISSTRYHQWYKEERENLFPTIHYTQSYFPQSA
ncbi:MAG: DNA methyltransferase [Candidatus Competibacteraceae bacterium]